MKIKGGEKHQLATAMDPWSKVELLTHHPGGGHGDVEASGMVFFLRQGAGTRTAISSRDRNRDGGGTEVGFEKRVLSRGFLIQDKKNIGQGGDQGVAPGLQAPRWRWPHPGRASWVPCPLVTLLRLSFVTSCLFWIKDFLEFFEHL